VLVLDEATFTSICFGGATLVGGRVVAGAPVGEGRWLGLPLAISWLALAVGAGGVLAAARSRRADPISLLLLGDASLVGGLIDPQAPSPTWQAPAGHGPAGISWLHN